MSSDRHQDSRLLRSAPAILASLIALAVTLVVVGNVIVRKAPGLPYSPELTLWLLPLSRLVADLSGAAMVGVLLTMVFLLPRVGSKLNDQSRKIAEVASYFAFAYAAANVSLVVFAISDILGISPSQALDRNILRSYLTQLLGGRVSLFQITSALLISLLAIRLRSSVAGFFLLLLALFSVGAPALTGHSGLTADHEIATSSLALHIIAVSIWVGGLFALTIIVASNPPNFAAVVQRFSRVALCCYIAVALSGAVNAWVRLRSVHNLVDSHFGRLVLLKLALTLVLAYLGWLNRTRALAYIRSGRNAFFYRIAAVEVAIMFTIVGVAVTLSRTGFPPGSLNEAIKPSASELIYGFRLPPTPSFILLLTIFRVDAIWLAFALLLLAFYLLSLSRVRGSGITWPVWRPISFGSGIVLLIYSTSGGLAAYAHVLFSAHMVQHILLLLVIPELLVLGQPFRLAVLAHSSEDAEAPSLARDLLNSKLIQNLSRLPVVAVLFASSFYLIYFTPLFSAWIPSHWGHVGMEMIIFVVGYLFIWNIFGNDLTSIVHSSWSRFRFLLICEPFHILFSVLLIWSTKTLASSFYISLQRPYRADLHHDQILGGILGWILGEVPMFLAGALLIRTLKRGVGISKRA